MNNINKMAKTEVLEYQEDADNLSKLGKLNRVNEYHIKQLVKVGVKYQGVKDAKLYYQALCLEFNKVGLYGKGNRYNSPSLDQVRSKLNVALESVIDNEDCIFTNNTYFFTCSSGAVVMVEGVIIKQATVGHMFTDTNNPNDKLTIDERNLSKKGRSRKLTIEALKEIKAMTDKPRVKAEQVTTK